MKRRDIGDTSALTRLLRVVVTLAVLGGGIVTAGLGVSSLAGADTPVTVTNETFNEPSFPPANWSVQFGTWTANCAVTSPMTGCAATDTVTGGGAGLTELFYNPTAGIPANLTKVQLSFYSDFTPSATSSGDIVQVMQALQPGDGGDFGSPLVNVVNTVAPPGTFGPNDAFGTPVLHTVTLPNLNVPIAFRWTPFGDSSPTATGTWAISNVTITGTAPANAFALTANPIVNTDYPHVIAGQPVTLRLSGSSNPTGDSLTFNVSTAPTLGHLGAITQVDATHANVVYTPNALACPDPTGVSGLICPDSFKYTVSDVEGNVSPPANVALDVQPGGANGQTPVIGAPKTAAYITLSHNGSLTQGVDLSGTVTLGPAGFPDAMQMEVLASSGTIDLFNAAASGASFLNGTANDETQIDMQGSPSQLNTALGEFLYFPPSGTTPTSTIQIFAWDMGATGNGPRTSQTQATVTVNGIVSNPPPSLAVPTGPLAIATNAGLLHFPSGAATGFFLTDTAASASTQDELLLNVSEGVLGLPASDTSGPNALVTAQSFGSGSTLDLTGTVTDLNLALPDLTFDPSGLFSGTATLSAEAVDPDTSETSPPASVSIAVTEAPFAFGASSFTTLENAPAVVFLCAGGPVGDTFTFQITASPQHGTFAVDSAANAAASGCSPSSGAVAYLYTPATGYVGPDGFTYTVTDPTTSLVSAPNTVAITVGAHQKPTAYDVLASTTEDHSTQLTLCGTNPDPDPNPTLTFTITSSPVQGTLTQGGTPALNPCNQGNVAMTYTYTPNVGTFTADGTDSFQYTVSNGTTSDPATGTIDVSTLTPQVFTETASVNEDSSIELNLCAVDPGGPLTFSFTSVVHGTLDQNGVGATTGPVCPGNSLPYGHVDYTPDMLFSGTETFGYSANDGSYTSALALITVTVNKVEIPPVANAQSVTDFVPHAVSITLSGSSLQGSSLTYRVVSGPSSGSLSGTAPNLVYTPSQSGGTDSFTFVANDGTADSAPATVTVALVKPSLDSSVCVAGAVITINQDACAGPLTSVPDGNGGTVQLAHTNGNRHAGLKLQAAISNVTAVPDTVTLTASPGTSNWPVFYDLQGSDVTAAITSAGGFTITLGPSGSGTDTAYVQIVVFSPQSLPAPSDVPLTVTATSGNDPTVTTSLPLEVVDGTSAPTLSLAQADGSGAVTFPTVLAVSPTLYDGGPSGTVHIEGGLTGTGDNTVRVSASTLSGSSSGVTPHYYLASLDVTSQVEAGTEVIQCYADAGCPPMRVVLVPNASGTVSGNFSGLISLTSTIDGQGQSGLFSVELAGTVGPDLVTYGPLLGAGVFETTPSTQVVSSPTELSGASSKDIYLTNVGDVTDTFTVHAVTTKAANDTSQVTVAATPANDLNAGDATDQTSAISAGTYQVTLTAGAAAIFVVTDTAEANTPSTAASVVLTATSSLESSKVDSFEVTFPTYFFRPDAILTGANGTPIGSGVYQQTYLGPVGNNQQDLYSVDQSPTHITVTLTDRGGGPISSFDSVLVKAPVTDPNFAVSYALTSGGTTTDVTKLVEGSGLPVSLGQAANGAPEPVITMTAAATQGGLTGAVGYFPLTVTSLSSLPSGLSDVVVVGLYNTGESQLRFGGLPQPEPSDITTTVTQDGLTGRIPPFPSAGYAAGATYGAYPDPTGQKFAYVSGWDTVDLQVAGEKVTPTRYRIQMVDPGPQLVGLPGWERDAFALPYYNGRNLQFPADPLAAGSNLHPTFTVNGLNVTSQVDAATYTTPALGTGQTSDITVSFNPAAGDSQRYTPIKFNLINAVTGEIEDVLVLDPTTILSCSSNGYAQVQAVTNGSSGHERLNFEAFNRLNPNAANDCLQQLSHSWITTAPVVFSSYVAASARSAAGGDNPQGLWLVPQGGSILRINTDTLDVTGSSVSAYVDSPFLNLDGTPDAATAAAGVNHYYALGSFTNLDWQTANGTNGLEVGSPTTLPAAPFPLVTPSTSDWPNNTMTANRYFQVDTSTGGPVMVGEMDVHVPWYNQNVPLVMPVDDTNGLVLQYGVPSGTSVPLPGLHSVSFYNFYWTTDNNGTVVQGGCLGVPSELFVYLGLSGGPSICLLGATVTFQPISSAPGAETKVSQVTVQLINPGVGVEGSPEFNLSGLTGEIDFDPTTQDATKVVLDPDFGIGPPTPCQLTQNEGKVTTVLGKIAYLPCPTNYFFFNAKLTYQTGGFSNNSTSGFGIQFSGTLTFLNVLNLANIEADISSDPFNFHFEDSPIDLSVNVGVPISATLTFSGDINANGFDIGIGGSVKVDGFTIASASGVLSTKGIGVCGGVAGVSMGFTDTWGGSPTFIGSGCSTDQFQVSA